MTNEAYEAYCAFTREINLLPLSKETLEKLLDEAWPVVLQAEEERV